MLPSDDSAANMCNSHLVTWTHVSCRVGAKDEQDVFVCFAAHSVGCTAIQRQLAGPSGATDV